LVDSRVIPGQKQRATPFRACKSDCARHSIDTSAQALGETQVTAPGRSRHICRMLK